VGGRALKKEKKKRRAFVLSIGESVPSREGKAFICISLLFLISQTGGFWRFEELKQFERHDTKKSMSIEPAKSRRYICIFTQPNVYSLITPEYLYKKEME
jgi:hypothetical protein